MIMTTMMMMVMMLMIIITGREAERGGKAAAEIQNTYTVQ
jgi:hypothetical protein